MMEPGVNDNWDIIIGEGKEPYGLNIGEILRYKDLLRMFIVKDVITVYKQTILGPIWFVVQPIMTTLIYTVVFGQLANIPTDGVPKILFYLGGITLWNYFSDTLSLGSKTFTENANVFGKVFFPRIILPLSKTISGLIKYFIQFGLFLVCWFYFLVIRPEIHPNAYILFFPVILLTVSVLSLGIGLIVTSLTTKYRDLTFLISFAIQLLMYATPVIYPISVAPSTKQVYLWLNPLSSLFELFKYGFLGKGTVDLFWVCYSILFTGIVFVIGVVIFTRIEKKFIDTV
jgi:lipopolysaccharide transport system permease protein